MNINILQNNNPYLSKTRILPRPQAKASSGELLNTQVTQKQLPVSKLEEGKVLQAAKSANSEITNNEINYFKNLFPANATQIDSYIAFNRKGNIVSNNISKGSIIDQKG